MAQKPASPDSNAPEDARPSLNFIQQRVEEDLRQGKNDGRVHTRFPPEPNGYLHIGHAKAICISYTLAEKYGGLYNLRFDDTNPSKEKDEFVQSIQEDIRWLGFDWEERLYFASSYFERLYQFAVELIEKGRAFVCDLNGDEMREYRGTLTAPGKNSPYRDRSAEENLDLFSRMRAGEFEDGAHTLRAKIDMASPNLNLRDPIIYRIQKTTHHRTGDEWPIYPMYDFAHGLSDAIENITHSLCSLEFENHRPLYDWFLDHLDVPSRPQQIEFARLNMTYTVMSKRKLRGLVEDGHVSGWDDPRMPTLSGLRRRGFTPESIRNFCEGIGVAKFNSTIDRVVLDNALRDNLNPIAQRYMGVFKPLKMVITNYPEGESEEVMAVNNPEDESTGRRPVPFSREVYIEQSDFMEDAPRKFFRLSQGREVRLRYAYYVTCNEVIKDDEGNVVELRCTYDPESKGGNTADGRKVKGTLHWVSAAHAKPAEVRLYDHLFSRIDPDKAGTDEEFLAGLNPGSLEVIEAHVEPAAVSHDAGFKFQFERMGYFSVDPDSTPEKPVLNRAVPLRDSWAKIAQKK